jgi:hypothetical protein
VHVLAAILAVSASLHVTVWPNGRDDSAKRTWTLRCAPAGGTLPRAANACQRLAALQNPFAPRRRVGVACTDVYGGPQFALVTGRVRSRPVRATFSRVNGCEIARWNRVRFLFPVPVGSSASG